MGENSKIEWTTHTFNPWRGCTKVHTGCANCYAEKLSGRNPKTLGVWGKDGTRVVAAESAWREPLKWDRHAHDHQAWHSTYATVDAPRPRVFCASLADVFEDWDGPIMHHAGGRMINCPECGWEPFMGNGGEDGCANNWLTLTDVRRRLFALIDATPNLDWLLLTKRPENVRRMWPQELDDKGFTTVKRHRPNVWIGASASDQPTLDTAVGELSVLDDLCPLRFLSLEPLVGPISFAMRTDGTGNALPIAKIGWVIVGGESGPKARTCNVDWIRSIVKECKAANVPCFVKQLGSDPMIYHGHREGIAPLFVHFRTRDAKGGNPDEWPADLRVRELPKASVTA